MKKFGAKYIKTLNNKEKLYYIDFKKNNLVSCSYILPDKILITERL